MSPPLIDVSGVILLQSRTLPGIDVVQHYYRFTDDADSETVSAVLACVSYDCELTFFDAEYPHGGAYIFVIRSADGLLTQCGEHGWSSRWVPITDQEAKRYLQECVQFDLGSGPEQLSFTQPSNWYKRSSVSRSRWNGFRRYLNKRLKDLAS